jgi:hypothetical protein
MRMQGLRCKPKSSYRGRAPHENQRVQPVQAPVPLPRNCSHTQTEVPERAALCSRRARDLDVPVGAALQGVSGTPSIEISGALDLRELRSASLGGAAAGLNVARSSSVSDAAC